MSYGTVVVCAAIAKQVIGRAYSGCPHRYMGTGWCSRQATGRSKQTLRTEPAACTPKSTIFAASHPPRGWWRPQSLLMAELATEEKGTKGTSSGRLCGDVPSGASFESRALVGTGRCTQDLTLRARTLRPGGGGHARHRGAYGLRVLAGSSISGPLRLSGYSTAVRSACLETAKPSLLGSQRRAIIE